jgi:hypothetical protein
MIVCGRLRSQSYDRCPRIPAAVLGRVLRPLIEFVLQFPLESDKT